MPEIAQGKGTAHDPAVSTDASSPREPEPDDTIERLQAKVAKQEAQLADAKAALAEAKAARG